MGLVLMAVALMSVTSVQQDVFAKDAGMSLTATAEEGGQTSSQSLVQLPQTHGAVTLVAVKTPDGC